VAETEEINPPALRCSNSQGRKPEPGSCLTLRFDLEETKGQSALKKNVRERKGGKKQGESSVAYPKKSFHMRKVSTPDGVGERRHHEKGPQGERGEEKEKKSVY